MKGFSLIELLCVVAILAILAVLTVPAIQSIGASQSLSQGAVIVQDQLTLARQQAVTRNRNVEVRIVEIGDGSAISLRGLQIWIESEDGSAVSPLYRMEILPAATVISADASLSPLLGVDSNRGGTAIFPGQGTRNFKAFRIRASGRLDSVVTTTNNFLTLCDRNDTNVPPRNFATLRINPVTARTLEYRP